MRVLQRGDTRWIPGIPAMLVAAIHLSSIPAWAAETDADPSHPASDAPPDSDADIADSDDDDTLDVDAQGSIEDAASEEGGWTFRGDIRGGYFSEDSEDREGLEADSEDLTLRIRFEEIWGISDKFRANARIAGICSSADCSPDFELNSAIPTSSGIDDGDFTLDELFVHWFRTERFDLAIGRLQTKFVARGGVYAKSLDRNDSNNVNVNWTDGMHGTLRARKGWVSHLILQRNVSDGTGNIRRGPLDFDDDDARLTYFLAFENTQPWGPLTQRAFDVSYLRESLLKDGDPSGRREDYWGLVGRLAARFPQRSEGTRLRIATEIGYAPETPTELAMQTGVSDDVDGFAWNIVASVMDFRPGHSLGINYAQTGAGWLLSPQYRQNEELFEIRYQWRPAKGPVLEARARWREEIDQLTSATQKGDDFDIYLRLTGRFPPRRP